MRRLLHYRSRCADGMTGARDGGHGTGHQIGAVHDRRIHLVASVAREHGAFACVKERVIFEHMERGLYRIDGRSALVENRRTRLDGTRQPFAIMLVAFGAQLLRSITPAPP